MAEEGFALATSIAYPKGVAYNLVAKAFAYFRLAKLGDAQECAQAGRDLFEQLGDREGLVRALNTLGMVYSELGELLQALEAFLNADVLYKELPDKEGEAGALNNIGNVYAYLGDYVNALDYYQQCLTVAEEEPLPATKMRALMNIGVTYYDMGQFETALEYFSRTVALEIDADPYTRALCSINLGRSYQQMGRFELAEDHLQRGLTLSQENDDPLGMSTALDSLADLALAAGRLPETLPILRQSLSLKEAAGDLRGQSETLLLLAAVDKRSHDLPSASRRLQRVLEITEQVGNPLERYKAFRELSEVHEQRENYKEALAYYRRYNELHEQVSRGAVGQQLQGLRLRFEISQSAREREIYRQKNAELALLNTDLQVLNQALREADQEKTLLLAELKRQAVEDALTRLYNRRYFDEVFSRSFAEAQRLATPLSAVIGDVDNFKGINDSFSHEVGDVVLKTIATLIKESVRAVDTVARYGGEEFVMLLPGASGHDALAICERLRAAVESYSWGQIHPELRVTMSIGVSNDLSVANHERMMSLADAKLYEAKRSGKNQVCF